MDPFFSICIPNYNYANYISITLDSVLKQSFDNFEIVIADNASTDDSWEVIQEYVAKDNRIRAYRNMYNIGFAPNLQKATQPARGKYMILLSSDDIMYPDALQTYHRILLENGDNEKTVIHAAFDQIDGSGNYIRSVFREANNFTGMFADKSNSKIEYRIDHQDPYAAIRYGLETNRGIGAFLTVCYPRKLWEQVEGYDPHYYIFPDKAFLFKLLFLQPNYIFVNKPLFGYRIHASNQNATNAGQAALKHQVDGYMRVINFNQKDLDKIGFTREQIQGFFIKNLCEKQAYIALLDNYRMKAFKILCFAWASFPKQSFRNTKLWILLGLLAIGPVGHWLVRSVYKSKTRND